MLISLPEEFVFVNGAKVRAFVETEAHRGNRRCKELKIYKEHVNFDDLMYAITYAIRKDEKCPYCGKPIKKKYMGLDHMYPRDFGGVSIPDNLIPCCSNCNSDKGSLDYKEYMTLLDMGLSKKEKGKEKRRLIKIKESRRFTTDVFLPEDWVEYNYLGCLEIREYYKSYKLFSDEKSKRLIQNLAYIAQYGKMKRPIVVDKNYFIIDGFSWYMAAVEAGRYKKVPIIVLENVELI